MTKNEDSESKDIPFAEWPAPEVLGNYDAEELLVEAARRLWLHAGDFPPDDSPEIRLAVEIERYLGHSTEAIYSNG